MRTVILALAFFAGVSGAAAAQETFDFKGIPLGVSLENMRHLRADDPHLANARVVCSGDAEIGPVGFSEVHLDDAEIAAGVRRCAYYNPPSTTGYSPLAYLGIGRDWIARDYEFDFFPDPTTGEHRLFRIALVTNVDARRFIYAALTDKFGQPDETLGEPVQNRMGARAERAVTRWHRPNAMLTVIAPSGRFDRMSVVYRLTDLSQAAEAAVRAAQSRGPDRM